MTERTAAFLIFFGFLLTFGAVGGMDDPSKINYFWEQIAAAAVGLGIMCCGTLGIKNSQYYDER